MKKNKISSILNYVKTQENQLLQSHQRHLNMLKHQEQALAKLIKELDELRMMDHTKITLNQLMNLQGYSELMRIRITDQEGVVNKQKDVVYESAQQIVEVRKDIKKYEKLEEKLQERLSKEEEEKVRKQLDEIGIRNYTIDK